MHTMASRLPISKSGDASTPNCKVILAQSVAKSLLSEVQEDLRKLGRSPLLVGFLANSDPAARMYADWTAKTCREKCESLFLKWIIFLCGLRTCIALIYIVGFFDPCIPFSFPIWLSCIPCSFLALFPTCSRPFFSRGGIFPIQIRCVKC